MKKILLFAVLSILIFSFIAEAQDFSITIDAEKDPFYETLTGQADGMVYLPARSHLLDIGDGSGPDDDADLSAIVWMSYDANYLYVYEEVKDDVVTASNGSRYLNDCIELKFDPDPSVGATSGTANMRLTALGEDLAENPAGVDNINGSNNLRDAGGASYAPVPEDYARKLTDDGYVLEFRVPFEYINVPASDRYMSWNEGDVFGMAINVADNDEGDRDAMLQWSAGHSDQAHSNPALLGMVTFLAGNKLKLEAISPIDPAIVNDSAAVWYESPFPAGVNDKPVVTEKFKMLTNYPNPFNPETKILYHIKKGERATLAIYNVRGELIRQLLVDQFHAAGTYEITWDGRNDVGETVSSGIYLYKLMTPSMAVSKKMMMLK